MPRVDDRAHTSIVLETVELERRADVVFGDVSDIAVHPDGDLYLLTRAPGAVVVYQPDGRYVRTWNIDTLVLPHGITIGGDGRIFLVDQGEHAVRIFAPSGEQLMVLGDPLHPSDTGLDWSLPRYKDRYLSIRHGGPPFNNPTKLALAGDGSMYVADGYGNTRVHHFSAEGGLLASWGEPGSGPGQFRLVHSVCVIDDGRVLVADRENERIQCFDADGRLLDIWDSVQRPTAVVELPSGNLLVSELGWNPGDHSFASGEISDAVAPRLSVLDRAGRAVARRTPGPEPLDLWRPHGLGLSPTGRAWVAQLGWPGSGAGVGAVVAVDVGYG